MGDREPEFNPLLYHNTDNCASDGFSCHQYTLIVHFNLFVQVIVLLDLVITSTVVHSLSVADMFELDSDCDDVFEPCYQDLFGPICSDD